MAHNISIPEQVKCENCFHFLPEQDEKRGFCNNKEVLKRNQLEIIDAQFGCNQFEEDYD